MILILNGPPGSGKDAIAEALAAYPVLTPEHLEFKTPLHNIAIAMTGLPREDYFAIYSDRSIKEVIHPRLLGFSPRGLLIHISEVLCKPHFGKDYFGKMAADAVAASPRTSVVFSDGGFPDEVNVLVNRFGKDKVGLIHLYREDCSFIGDSRDYILEADTGIKPRTVYNNGTIKEALMSIRRKKL